MTETLADLLYPPRCALCDEVLSRAERGKAKRISVPGMECGKAKKISVPGMERGKAGKISVPGMPRGRTGKIPVPGMPRGCCAECDASLPWVRELACMKCGKPIGDEGQEYCWDCRVQRHFFDRGVAAFSYTDVMRHSVLQMKMQNRRDHIPFYAEAMAMTLARRLPSWRPEVILPVPMHARKRRVRGYNQSELLAREIGRLTGIPVESRLLRCTRPVRAQKELGREERLRNLRGSIAVCKPFPGYSRVLLVDDVYTTGSTMDEISRVLREQGVRHIFFVVLCTGKGKKAVCTDKKV